MDDIINTNNIISFLAPLIKINPITHIFMSSILKKNKKRYRNFNDMNNNIVQNFDGSYDELYDESVYYSQSSSSSEPPRVMPPPVYMNNNKNKRDKTIVSTVLSIFSTLLLIYALYISFKCNKGFHLGSFLLACCCSPFYIAYRLAVPCVIPL